MDKEMQCAICKTKQKSDGNVYSVSEMMFGTRKAFDYFLCENCRCLQIISFPEDMSEFYPANYYSFDNLSGIEKIKEDLKAIISKFGIGRSLLAVWNHMNLPMVNLVTLIKKLPHRKLLDVGCGSGKLLNLFAGVKGFDILHGVDLYIENEIVNKTITIKKGVIHDIHAKDEADKYDIIMLNHSLEHMPNQQPVFDKIKTILKKDGVALIRIPVMNLAWELYGTNWFQIDAPRHFFIHTEKSIKILAENAGLYISRVLYDSMAFQFTASELYEKGIPLTKQSASVIRKEIGRKKFAEYKRKAAEANITGKGDQAVFIIKHKV